MDEPTPIFNQLADEYRAGRHHWREQEPDTGEVTIVGRHYDADADGLADQRSWPDGWQVDPTAHPADGPCEDRADPDSWDDPSIYDAPYGEFAEPAR